MTAKETLSCACISFIVGLLPEIWRTVRVTTSLANKPIGASLQEEIHDLSQKTGR